ncbi:hypothetical protein GMD78_13115 [Ornithinibacillus sp. L9]|uniref:Uncharacterized protein n=1 Tax=Ornithinibacillus caprae TaxID=2678566 RepID=A0A6N8FI20_9BACI|nr:hypothetical protein [Ornithinibacillus caprae]MUK89312.1 hypothetical protein [Ornithinibacillus caprae]
MWDITYDLNRLIAPEKNGYDFIKKIKLYIPYREIGLNTLIRSEQSLPFFYEVIMKLVENKCNEIVNISELTGVEEEILNDVVGEMSILDLVFVKSNVLNLTVKGKETLKELTQTVIEREEINQIYVNTINGKIVDLEQQFKKPENYSASLDEVIRVSEEYIHNRFNDFNDYYLKRQEEYALKDLNFKKEIFQILGKEYERLCYIEKIVYVYRNNKDNDLIYHCEDDEDNIYATTLARQINYLPSARNFLDNPFNCAKHLGTNLEINKEMKENTEKLVVLIENSGGRNIRDYSKELTDYYFANRYLLDKEYIEILLLLSRNIRPSEIIISSSHLEEILNHNVITELQVSLDHTKVTIFCDSNGKRNNHLKSKVMNFKSKNKKKNKILWVEGKAINQTNIVLYPQCAITINYMPIPVGNDYLIQEIAEITFEPEEVYKTKKLFDVKTYEKQVL